MKIQSVTFDKLLVNFLLYSLRGIFIWYSIMLFLLIYKLVSPSIYGRIGITNLPVVFKTARVGNLNMENGHVNSWFYINGNGTIHTDGLPPEIFYLSWTYNLLSTAVLLLVIHLICKILQNVRKGNFLLYENAIILRYIALLNIGVLILNKLFLTLSQLYLIDKLEFPNIEFISSYSLSFPSWKEIFLSLFLLIIAEAFRVGAQLKQENDLTI